MLQQGGPGAHTVNVAAQGVDLAVMGHVAEGLGQIPGREGVGAVTLMDKGDGADDSFIGQFRKEGFQLLREQHAFVKNGAAGERTDVEELLTGKPVATNRILGAFTGQKEHQLKAMWFDFSAADKDLHDLRFNRTGVAADGAAVGDDFTPAEDAAADSNQLLIQCLDAGFTAVAVLWQKDDTGTVLT